MDFTPSLMAWLICLGVLVGTISGMLGIGGGVIVVPILMFGFGFSQRMANGTSLAMLLPPVGLLAIGQYYKSGQVNVPAAALMALGFLAGAWIGGALANSSLIPEHRLRQFFGFFMLYLAGMMLFRSQPTIRAAIYTAGVIAVYGLAYFGAWVFGKRLSRSIPQAAEVYHDAVAASSEPDYEI